jgi:uridine nucleosidase
MYEALSSTPPHSAWLVSTGALTNIALLFSVFPHLIEHIRGLSIMGGAIGGFFTHAPVGRIRDRVPLSSSLSRQFPEGHTEDSGRSIKHLADHFRSIKVLNADHLEDEEVVSRLQAAHKSFGNTTDYAEFNIYCDPEAAAAIFANGELAAKTTLIPLDVTHQVLGGQDVVNLLSNGHGGSDGKLASSAVRHLFLEILTFFSLTYEREFGMLASEGPPLHDPIAVAAAFAPDMFDDNNGERFEVFVVKAGDEKPFDNKRHTSSIDQCGRTIARKLPTGVQGVRIPRALRIPEFWHLINFALEKADLESTLVFPSKTQRLESVLD